VLTRLLERDDDSLSEALNLVEPCELFAAREQFQRLEVIRQRCDNGAEHVRFEEPLASIMLLQECDVRSLHDLLALLAFDKMGGVMPARA
jgi:hypothetical protein